MPDRQYIVDVETLDVESTAVILSVAVIRFELNEIPNWTDFLYRSVFIKFNAEEQIKNYGRTVDPSTLKWWKKQCKHVKDKSFRPSTFDVSAVDGFAILREECGLDVDSSKNKDVRFWARGSLDQITLDSLSKKVSGDLVIPYNNFYDIRTAIDLTKENAFNGYCDVPGFNRDLVIKHDPVQDCAYDLVMLLSGNIKNEQA